MVAPAGEDAGVGDSGGPAGRDGNVMTAEPTSPADRLMGSRGAGGKEVGTQKRRRGRTIP